jgi:hypothetical protein
MGMDVYGKAATTEAGTYFRNNVWSWRPLADFILETAPADLTEGCAYWHSNDGDGLDEETSRKLAVFLRHQIETGAAQNYIDERARKLAALPMEPCRLCGATGIRSDAIGVEHGQTTRKIEKKGHPRNGQIGWCNACDGVGSSPHWDTHYRLDIDNIANFADFLEGCGGFEIN